MSASSAARSLKELRCSWLYLYFGRVGSYNAQTHSLRRAAEREIVFPNTHTQGLPACVRSRERKRERERAKERACAQCALKAHANARLPFPSAPESSLGWKRGRNPVASRSVKFALRLSLPPAPARQHKQASERTSQPASQTRSLRSTLLALQSFLVQVPYPSQCVSFSLSSLCLSLVPILALVAHKADSRLLIPLFFFSFFSSSFSSSNTAHTRNFLFGLQLCTVGKLARSLFAAPAGSDTKTPATSIVTRSKDVNDERERER